MSGAAKRLQQMRNNPKGDWTIDDIAAVCRAYGMILEPPSSGSHFTIIHRPTGRKLSIPARRPIKPVYIRDFVRLVESIGAKP
jgi:hypothetical protein